MKKITLLFATICIAFMSANAQFTESENWAWGEKGWEYIGEPMTEPITIDFTTWTVDDLPPLYHNNAWYMTGTTKTPATVAHEDVLVEKQGLGFYKYAFYGERSLTKKGETTAQPLKCIYNSGLGMDEEYIGAASDSRDSCFRNNGISLYKRPAIYIPAFKYGIKQIRVTLAVNQTSRTFFNQTLDYMPDQLGNDSLYWRGLDNINANAGKGVYDEYVIEMNSEEETLATKILSYASTEYPFILKIEVIPQPSPTSSVLNNVFPNVTCRATNQGVLLKAKENVNVKIYSISGAIVASVNVLPNQSTFVALPEGCYIVNRTKILVK